MARIARFIPLFVLIWSPAPFAGAGEPPPVMLATAWEHGRDPTGWWISEKYDGLRGYWDGQHMLSRGGESIALPRTFTAALPPFALDGELWAGRGRFEQTAATVRDATPGPGWGSVRYMVFDAPAHPGPFEARLEAVRSWLATHPDGPLELAPQTRCKGAAHLARLLERVDRDGGEGLMLRSPGSPYQAGRSPHLRKLKSFDDTEARVIGYNPGKGRLAGMVGSLRMELPDGTRFNLGAGLADAQRRAPPPLGSVVTFRHHGWTAGGKPRFPVFWRVREVPGVEEGL